MSSDKNFPQRHITKRSLEKSNVCTFSSYIIQTLLKHSRLFAFVRASHLKNIIQNKRVGINAYFSADRSNTLKFPYLVHLFRHYCVKIIAACPFFLQGEHNISLYLPYSFPVLSVSFSLPFSLHNVRTHVHVHEEVACFVSRNDKHRSLKSRD